METVLTPPTFRPVRRQRVFQEVAAQLRQQIAEGRFRPGDRLPSERELAEAFGVSRASVRDAIRVLELAGLVEPRQGEGTVVRELTLDALVSPLAAVLAHEGHYLPALLDARTVIEPPVAYRAARHASAEDLAALEEILARQAARVAAGELAIDEDTAFHYRLGVAAGNPVLLKLVDVLMDLLHESRVRSLGVPGRPERSLAGHRRILAAVRARDPEGASAAMRQHLEEIGEMLAAARPERAGRSRG